MNNRTIYFFPNALFSIFITFWVVSLNLSAALPKSEKIGPTSNAPLLPERASQNFQINDNKDFPLIKHYFGFEFTDEFLDNWEKVLVNFYDNATEKQVKKFDLLNLTQRSVTQHWDIKRKRVDIAKARASIVSAVGRLLPHLNVAISLDPLIPVNLSYLFQGLFSFVIPSHWFNLFYQTRLLQAEKYALTDLMLDRYTATEVAYYQSMQMKWHFAIQTTFYHNIQDYLNMFSGNPNVDQNTLNMMFNFTGGLADRILEAKQTLRSELFPNLVYESNLIEETKNFMFDLKNINPPNLSQFSKLDHHKYWDVVIKNSLKLKIIEQIRKAELAHVGKVATSTIGLVGENPAVMGISIGLENLTDPLIALLELKKISADYDQMRSTIHKNLMSAINIYNVTLDRFQIHLFFLEQKKINFENVIAKSLANDNVDMGVYFSATELMNSYLEINHDFFTFLQANIALNRLLVTPVLQKVMNYIPLNHS